MVNLEEFGRLLGAGWPTLLVPLVEIAVEPVRIRDTATKKKNAYSAL